MKRRPHLFARFKFLISANLGRCPRCMRWSLRGAVSGWLALGGLWLWAPQWVAWAMVWPASFSALWLVHITTFGGRAVHAVVKSRVREAGDPARDATPGAPALFTRQFTRRELLNRFAQAAVFAAAASAAVPRLHASDDDGCPAGMHLCRDDKHCCPNGASYDCLVDHCDPKKSRRCYPDTDDNLHYLQQCCTFISCP